MLDFEKLNKLREIRDKNNLTLKNLSRKCGVSSSAINRIENFQVIPNQLEMIYIAKSLKMDVSEIFKLN